jgi:hypothetical protein
MSKGVKVLFVLVVCSMVPAVALAAKKGVSDRVVLSMIFGLVSAPSAMILIALSVRAYIRIKHPVAMDAKIRVRARKMMMFSIFLTFAPMFCLFVEGARSGKLSVFGVALLWMIPSLAIGSVSFQMSKKLKALHTHTSD